MKELFDRWGNRVHFLDVVTRQAHPGPRAETYESYGQKIDSARQYAREESIPWTVLADDLPGTTHESYGTMTDPSYLIDANGRVAYYCMWTYVPRLHWAIESLLSQGGVGIVDGGIDQVPHLGAAFVGGWRGVRRGGPRAVLEYELAAPGSAAITYLGNLARPVLAPLALRSTPLPRTAKWGLGLGAAAAGAVGLGAAFAALRKVWRK